MTEAAQATPHQDTAARAGSVLVTEKAAAKVKALLDQEGR